MSLILTLSGMSTCGKSTLAAELSKTDAFDEAVSVTTRPMRAGEVDGKDYHFVSQAKFDEYVRDGVLIEHVRSHHACYGVPHFEVERIRGNGQSVIMVLEPEGVSSINRLALKANDNLITAFIQTNPEKLMERFFDRIHNQVVNGKPLDTMAEAKRLHTMLTVERTWVGCWDWDLTLMNLHLENRLEEQVEAFVSMHERGVTVKPIARELKPTVKPESHSLEKLADLIRIQRYDPVGYREFYKTLMEPMMAAQRKIRYHDGVPSPEF
jgi:guanylate kinase